MLQRLKLRARANLFWAYREKKSVDSIPCLVHLPDFSLAGPAQLVNVAADPSIQMTRPSIMFAFQSMGPGRIRFA